MLRTLLVAAALTQQSDAAGDHGGVKEKCSCAQAEPDHPFTIDCDDTATIRAATTTLESTCKVNNAGYEWGGAFPTPDNAYKWVAQAKDGAYADPSMKLVVFDVHAADKEHLLELAETAKTLIAGTCTVVNTQGTIPAPTEAGACYTLTFPTDPATDFHATVTTTGVANVAFFGEHGPTEFERDTHYLMKDGMTAAAMASATSAGSGGPVEPGAETDAEEFNCRLLKDGQVKTCAQAFLVIQAHHDYCPHDTLTRYEEELFHQWESKCHGCSIVRMYNANLKNCPVVDCTDDGVAQLGYDELKDSCTAADTSFAFEWAGSFPTPADSYKWVAQAATKANETDVFPAGHSYADPEMKMVVYAMTSTLKSELFGKKDDADELMSSGPCTVVNTQGTIPAPTEAGACYTLTFPTDPATDFHATVTTTGVANVAFFTAHMPTEFERDTHYLMKDDMTAAAMASATSAGSDGPVEPDNQLGESGGHDHGRRLSAVGRNDRRSRRRLANPGSCCNTARQQGAWKQVVSYHDQCDHSQVPEYIEVGFHDYEASCEEFFCNLIGPDEDQTVCPYAPPSPPVGETTYTNCGVTTTLANAPERVVALHQGSIELMLAMGLEDKMVGTASMDDTIWPRYKEAYNKIKILTPSGLPNETTIMAVQPDFIIGAYRSAFAEMRCDAGVNCRTDDSHGGIFSDATVGPCDGENSDYFPAGETTPSNKTSYSTCRPQLNANGIGTWLWEDYCEDPALRPDGGATEETVYKAVTQLGEIFNVPDVARQLNADIRNDFKVAEEALASSGPSALKAVWLDCMPDYDGTNDKEGTGCCRDGRPGWDSTKKYFVGGGHGGPNIIMQESGLVNAFANKPDSWYCVSMEEIIAADPDVFVIVDANWDNATKKLDYLHNHTDFCGMRAVKRADYIKIQFSASNLGPRNGVAALDMVNAALHVTTGAETMNFNSGVDFFAPEALVKRTENLHCPVVLENIKYAGSLISPSPPPPPKGSTYTFNVIAEGELSDFDDAKVKSIKESIADKAGVAIDDVYVQIRAASVDIVVQIKVSDYGLVANKVDQYLTSASEATELLGGDSVVTVVSVVSAPTPYPKPESGDDLPGWAIGVIAVVCVLLVAVLTCAIAMFLRERAGKPMFTTLEPKDNTAAGVEKI